MRLVKWLRVWLIVFAGYLASRYVLAWLFGWGRHSPRLVDQALMSALFATFVTLLTRLRADTGDPSQAWRSAAGQGLLIGLLMSAGVYFLAGAALDRHTPFGDRIVAGLGAVVGTLISLVGLAAALWSWRNRQPR